VGGEGDEALPLFSPKGFRTSCSLFFSSFSVKNPIPLQKANLFLRDDAEIETQSSGSDPWIQTSYTSAQKVGHADNLVHLPQENGIMFKQSCNYPKLKQG
jgi:hypothetical protein